MNYLEIVATVVAIVITISLSVITALTVTGLHQNGVRGRTSQVVSDDSAPAAEPKVPAAEPQLISVPEVDIPLLLAYLSSREIVLSESKVNLFYHKLLTKQGWSSSSGFSTVLHQSPDGDNVQTSQIQGTQQEADYSSPAHTVHPVHAQSRVAFAPVSETIHSSILSIEDPQATLENAPTVSPARAVAESTARVLDWGQNAPSNVYPGPLRVNADVAADLALDDVINASHTPTAQGATAGTQNFASAPLRVNADMAADVAPSYQRRMRLLSASELRDLQKSAKDMQIPRLATTSTFGLFSAWKSAVIDWLTGACVIPGDLHVDTIKYLSHRLLTPEFHEELRRQGVWAQPTWDHMVSKIREALGFDKQQLRAKLRECKQGVDEQSKAFLSRFCWLKEEGDVADAEAKDILLNSITVPTRTFLERKLEGVLEDDPLTFDLLPADRIETIPFSTFKRLLSRGPLLEAYPAKPSKLDLRAKVAAAATESAPSQVGSSLISLSMRGAQASAATAGQVAVTSDPAGSPCDPFDTYLQLASVTLNDQLVADPLVTLAGLAAVLRHSQEVNVKQGTTAAGQAIAAIAGETADRVLAVAQVHPALKGFAAELAPRRRDQLATQRLFDVARGFSRRVPMSRLLEIEPEIRPYLATLVVRAIHRARGKLFVPEGLDVEELSQQEFEDYQLGLAAKTYPHYGALQQMVQEQQEEKDPLKMLARQQGETQQINTQLRDLTSAMKAMKDQMQGYFDGDEDDYTATSKWRRTGEGTVDQGMRTEKMKGGDAMLAFCTKQRAFITQVEAQAAKATAPGPCQVTGVASPVRGMDQYTDLSREVPPLRKSSKQAHVPAVILGGFQEGKGAVIFDTGAGLSIVTERFCQVHGLHIKGQRGQYTTASFAMGELLGHVNFGMQLNNQLVISIEGIAVQPGHEYQVLIGGDIMWDDQQYLGKVKVTPGDKVSIEIPSWDNCKFSCPTLAQRDVQHVTATTPDPAAEQLPPPPEATNKPATVAQPPRPDASPSYSAISPTLAGLDTPLLTPAQKKELGELCKQRQNQLDNDIRGDDAEALQQRIKLYSIEQHLPKALRYGLGQCLWRRFPTPAEALVVVAIKAFERNEEYMWGELTRYGVNRFNAGRGKGKWQPQAQATATHPPPTGLASYHCLAATQATRPTSAARPQRRRAFYPSPR